MSKRRAIYPGSFDPVTNGHIDVIRRSLGIFDEVIVGVAQNVSKDCLFSVRERVEMLKEATRGLRGVTVEGFDGLVVAYARRKKVKVVIRGLRMISDFEYEFQMALTNRKLQPEVETVFLMPSESFSYLSSKLIKEAVSLGADVRSFVPPAVEKKLRQRLRRGR